MASGINGSIEGEGTITLCPSKTQYSFTVSGQAYSCILDLDNIYGWEAGYKFWPLYFQSLYLLDRRIGRIER
jgi:hypothetical protein